MAKKEEYTLGKVVQEVKKLLGKGSMKKLFALLDEQEELIVPEKFQEYLSIKSSFGSLNQQIIKDTISREDRVLEESKIRDRLLNWLSEVEVVQARNTREKFGIGIAALVLAIVGLFALRLVDNKLTVFPTQFSWNFSGVWQLTLESANCDGRDQAEVFLMELTQFGNELLGKGRNISGEGPYLLFSGKVDAKGLKIQTTLSSPNTNVLAAEVRQTLSFANGQVEAAGGNQNPDAGSCSQSYSLTKIDS